jgi:hypothetical protein
MLYYPIHFKQIKLLKSKIKLSESYSMQDSTTNQRTAFVGDSYNNNSICNRHAESKNIGGKNLGLRTAIFSYY